MNRPQVNISFIDSDAIEQEEPHIGARGRSVLMAALLIALVFAVYAIALRGQFIFGDDITVSGNILLRSWHGLAPIWAHPTLLPHYQPLAYTLLSAEFKLFGTTAPAGYLFVNILLHASNVVLLWMVLRKLQVSGAMAVTAVFAVHPINVEAVAWISPQPLLLCAGLYLASILAYFRFYPLSLLLCMAAVLCHPAAVSLPLIALILRWWQDGRIETRDIKRLLPMLLMCAAWAAVTLIADHRHHPVSKSPLIAGRAVWIYLRHLLVPLDLSFAYPKWPTAIWQWSFHFAIAGLLIIAWRLRRRVGRGVFAAAAIFVLALLPMLFFRSDLDAYSYVADHLAYLPSIAVIVILARARWLAAVLVVAFATLTLLRISDYRTSQNLWAAVLRSNPGSIAAHNNLGLFQLNENRNVNAARQQFMLALQTNENDVSTLINLGMTCEFENDFERAMNYYFRALNLEPKDPEVHFGLAKCYAAQNDSRSALEQYQIVLDSRPDDVTTLNNIGLLFAQRGELDLAIETYQKAIKINPSFTQAYINLATARFNKGDLQLAAETLERVVQFDPTNFEAFMNAGAMTGRMAQSPANTKQQHDALLLQSEYLFRKAVSIRPSSAEASTNLAAIMLLEEKFDDSIFYFGRAAELDPQNPSAAGNLEVARRAKLAHAKPN